MTTESPSYVPAAEYFESRKQDRNQFEGAGSGSQQQAVANMARQAYATGKDQRMWSKKMEQNKTVRLTKGLGSTSNYLGDVDDGGPRIKEEKIKFINVEEEKRREALKDQASVKYNYQDFLKQFGNLTEQCTYLVESLSKGSQECIICHNSIYQRSALWNCN